MRRAFKYRLLPTKEQAALINKTVGCARLVYNAMLFDYKEQLNNGVKPKLKEVTYFKQMYDFLSEVDSLALANAKQHLQRAFKNYFDSKKGKRKGKKVKFPKKHKKSKCKLSFRKCKKFHECSGFKNHNIPNSDTRNSFHHWK